MKKLFALFILVSLTIVCISQEMNWPREWKQQGNVLTIYQPQIENWDQYKTLDSRMAFTLEPLNQKEVVGVVYLSAITVVDMDNHIVTISKLQIKMVDFPSLDSTKAIQFEKTVKSFLPADTAITMPLEQLVATTKKSETPPTVKVINNPPKIFISIGPAILLQLEGEAKLESTKSDQTSTLEYIINANWPVFYDKSNGKNYLFDDQEWQVSSNLAGPWEFTSDLPQELVDLVQDSAWSVLKPAIPAPFEASKNIPKIFFSESPAEIILFDGQPVYKTITGTSLEYATNTESDILFCINNSTYYYLTSGRWFSSRSLNGPWVFATNDLPADFAKIPTDSPEAFILASVPGTDEAADAVMIAQIPTVQVVNPVEAEKNIEVTYSGEPDFEPIQGTSMEYAVNTSEKVIELNSSSYYLCSNAIWFTSTSPNGPWETATTIPAEIYNIPSSSPVYNVTYVTQTTTSNGDVQSSYTSGYMGAVVVGVTMGAIVASGTGYYHPPYYYYPPHGYPVCYHYPCTYGAYAYHAYPYYGVGHGAAYNPYTGTYARSATAYGPYGSRTVAQAYNPYTGTVARGGSVSTPYGTTSAAHAYNPYTGASANRTTTTNAYGSTGAAHGYNPSTGTSAATRQESGAYGSAGTSTVNREGQSATTAHASNLQGSVGAGATSTGGKVVTGSDQAGRNSAVKTSSGNMYASKDGNVYKNTDGNWSQVNNSSSGLGAQRSTQTPASQHAEQGNGGSLSQGDHNSQMQNMNRENQNRQRGSMQSSQFSGGRSFGGFGGNGSYVGGIRSGGFSGGGFRGGGGFRR
jgi:hypothetical protein